MRRHDAIDVYSSRESFNLCQADICQTPKNNVRVEAAMPPPEAIADVARNMDAAGIDPVRAACRLPRAGSTLKGREQ